MSIQCQICNKEFPSLITSTHLLQHEIKTADYINMFGADSLASPEYRTKKSIANSGINNPNYNNRLSAESKKIISEKNTGNVPWNKGLILDDTSAYKEAAAKREEKYKSGELIRTLPDMNDKVREQISVSVKKYADLNKEELKNRNKKSIETKKSNGYDFAFFKGRTHSIESRKKISDSNKKVADQKRSKSIIDMKDRITNTGYTFISNDDKTMTVKCNQCNSHITRTLQMFQPSKIHKEMCNVCYPPLLNKSKGELEIYEFIKLFRSDAISGFREKYHEKELDIFIPSLNLGIEYNGLYWHSEKTLLSNGHSKTKDHEKMLEFNRKGIRLIQIFEDEWTNKQEIVKQRLMHIIHSADNERIHTRKCVISEISSSESSEFCNKYHIQGNGRSNVRVGLKYNNELIAVMTFSNDNLSRKIQGWELNRFCTANYIIPGAASKLFSYFVNTYNPNTIITYADCRWSEGNIYKILGFTFEKNSQPGYWYIMPNTVHRIHRFNLRKNSNDDPGLTEYENRLKQGYLRIWDCGNSKWVWNKNSSKIDK